MSQLNQTIDFTTAVRNLTRHSIAKSYELQVVDHNGRRQIAVPATGVITIGRGDACDVRVQDPLVSRHHSSLHVENTNFTLEDQGSSNGTFIGGDRIAEKQRVSLCPGDAFFIGSSTFVIRERQTRNSRPRAWREPETFALAVSEAAASDAELSLLRVTLSGPPVLDWGLLLIGAELGAEDLITFHDPAEYRVLLAGANEAAAKLREKQIERVLAEWNMAARLEHLTLPPSWSTTQRSAETQALFSGVLEQSRLGNAVVVEDVSMMNLYKLIDRVAPGDINVLIRGETGVGKDVIAQALHERSPRKDRPFVRINCAALSEQLIESELFGHEAGSFTGSRGAKAGLLEAADRGTVFLDEIGELPLSVQAKFLRVLESKEVTKVGGVRSKAINVRFISATNRPLEKDITNGHFREDLFYRLAGVSVTCPSLRQRRAEIAPLARHFLHRACTQLGRTPELILSPASIEKLEDHDFPGNVRELRNIVERAALLAEGPLVVAADISFDRQEIIQVAQIVPIAEPVVSNLPTDERSRIIDALERCAGNQSRAAEFLDMPRRTLVKKLVDLDIPRPRRG